MAAAWRGGRKTLDDWNCSSCGAVGVFGSRSNCFRCNAPRVRDAVAVPAAEAALDDGAAAAAVGAAVAVGSTGLVAAAAGVALAAAAPAAPGAPTAGGGTALRRSSGSSSNSSSEDEEGEGEGEGAAEYEL
jgi:hypothetical protein